MGLGDFLKGRDAREAAARQHEAKQTLAALERIKDLARVDLGTLGITAEKLQAAVGEVALSPAQEHQLLALANRPEIKEQLPPVAYPDLKPTAPLPDREILEQALEPLNEQEMARALETFGADFAKGRLPTFVTGHVIAKNSVRLSPDHLKVMPAYLRPQAERDPEGTLRKLWGRTSGEYPVWIDRLVPGYDQARQYFGQPTYDSLMTKPGWAFPEGVYIHERLRARPDATLEQDRQAVGGPQKRVCRTTLKDVYLPRQTAYEAALPQSPAHLDKKLGKVVRAVDHEVEAVKMLEIRIADNTRTIRSEPRSQYLSVTILLGPSNRVQEGLTRESPYRTYLRALRTNPGFFFEALRRHAPEVFEVGNGRKFYGEEGEQWEPDIMTMHLNVPELKAVGEPKTKTFQKMNL